MWLPRTRYHLHRTFVVKIGGPDPYKLKTSKGVARCIRKVVIYDSLWNEVNDSVLPRLGNVDQLHLGSPQRHEAIPRQISATEFPRFPTLKKLRVEDRVSFCSVNDLYAVLEGLKNLSHLYIDLNDTTYIGDWLLQPLPAAHLVTPRFSLPLQTLHLEVAPTPGPVPQELLAIAGASLKHFSILIVSLTFSVQETCKLSVILHHYLAYVHNLLRSHAFELFIVYHELIHRVTYCPFPLAGRTSPKPVCPEPTLGAQLPLPYSLPPSTHNMFRSCLAR